jgi:hypothetical protein
MQVAAALLPQRLIENKRYSMIWKSGHRFSEKIMLR